jgi:phosphofructokinase-like protein
VGAPRRIGLLTGGGDCPGLNAVIRAVTKDALHHGIEVLGIEDGFLGLIEDRMRPLGYADVSGILAVGGTILGSSNRADPRRFAVGRDADGAPLFADVSATALEHAERAGLEALVAIGGDGTLACAAPFAEAGLPVVGIPKTIDNDVRGTDLTFGFQTAVSIATEALDRVHTTAASHHRALCVEVMGRDSGWLALHAGLASGADVILIPELPFDPVAVADQVRRRHAHGKRYTVLCVAEGAHERGGAPSVAARDDTMPEPVRLGGIGARVAAMLERDAEVEARHVVLGHVQRGGSPVAGDRVLATRFGHHALELVRAGQGSRMVSLDGRAISSVPLSLPASGRRRIEADEPLLEVARAVYTSFGDGASDREWAGRGLPR